ncbi:hypothetical protein MBLNU230_g6839t1 [Neophaeotheca triangularis]
MCVGTRGSTLGELLAEKSTKDSQNLALVCMHQSADHLPIDFSMAIAQASQTSYLRWTHGQLQHAGELVVLVHAAAILGCPFVPLNAKGVSNAAELEYMLTLSGARILVLPEVETIKKLDHIVPEVLRESRLGIVLGGGSGGSPRGWMCCNELCKEAVGDASCTNGHEDGNETGTQATVRGGGKDSDATDKMEALAMIIFTSGTASNPKGAIYSNTTISASLLSVKAALGLDAPSKICGHMPNHHIGGAGILLSFLVSGGCVVFPSASFDPRRSLKARHPCYVPLARRYRTQAGARVRICAPEAREPVPRGETGEIHISGPQVIRGHLDNISAKGFYDDDQGRWFVTGDQAVMASDGDMTTSGRYKDLIIRGGESIAPAAIEAVFDAKMGYRNRRNRAVDNLEDLSKLRFDGTHFKTGDTQHPYTALRVEVAHLNSTNTAGFTWSAEHSAFDGLSLYSFIEDLDALLARPNIPPQPHVSYKLWADTYWPQRTSQTAKTSAKRQARRLRNLGTHRASLFPAPANAPNPAADQISYLQQTTSVAPVLWTTVPDLGLKTTHNLSPFLLPKAALSLFLTRKTPTPTALFAQNENGRSWPNTPA